MDKSPQIFSKVCMKREKYIKELKQSGKSYLLFKLFKEYLINKGIDKDHIIKIQLVL